MSFMLCKAALGSARQDYVAIDSAGQHLAEQFKVRQAKAD
jgi:hypothetical protein